MESWDIKEKVLVRVFEFEDFLEAIKFVNAVTVLAEEAKHHPDLEIFDYKFVKVKLVTHDSNKITEKDLKLGKEIGELYGKED